MIDRLKKLNPAHVWLLSLVVSAAMMGGIVAAIGVLLRGEVSHDSLLIGFAASLVFAFFIGIFLNYFIDQHKKIEGNSPLAASGSNATENMAADDALPQEKIAKAAPCIAMPQDIAESKKPEEQAGDSEKHSCIRRAIKKLDVLPAMPAIAQKLLALNLNTEEGERMLLVLIGQDPQISAKIIGLANSAAIGASRRITSLKDATLLLGAKRVQSVATGIAIISMMAKTPSGKFNIQDLWSHGFRIAFAAQGIARYMPSKTRPPDEQIFLAGTLHDIGYLVLAYLDPELSDRLHSRIASEPARPVMEIEHEILDMCHDELGAELAHHWNLPEEIVAVLRYHHNPGDAGSAAGQPLVGMIDIAQKLLPPEGAVEYASPAVSVEEWKFLGIHPDMAEEIKEHVCERAEQAMRFVVSLDGSL